MNGEVPKVHVGATPLRLSDTLRSRISPSLLLTRRLGMLRNTGARSAPSEPSPERGLRCIAHPTQTISTAARSSALQIFQGRQLSPEIPLSLENEESLRFPTGGKGCVETVPGGGRESHTGPSNEIRALSASGSQLWWREGAVLCPAWKASPPVGR